MRMPAQDHSHRSPALKRLRRLESIAQTSFSQEHPEVATFLAQQHLDVSEFRQRPVRESQEPMIPSTTTFDQSVAAELQDRPAHYPDTIVSHISHEEFSAVIDKLQHALAQPPGHIAAESQLYLEQQLSDLLGMSVMGSLDDHELPFHTGTIESEAHRRRFPSDELPAHRQFPEAGLRNTRSFFGWFITDNALSDLAEQRERYTLSLPLAYLPQWSTAADALKAWYKYRKVIVINPFDARAVVACIGDVTFSQALRYQFGGSPELIREGMFWSPACQGRACVLFIDESFREVPLGPLQLRPPTI